MLLYLHIPYCDSKCHYCSFNSYVDKFDTRQSYMGAIVKQLEYEIKHFKVSKHSISTLFIGGGTPSTIDPELYKPFFQMINPYLVNGAEITTEANPNSAKDDWLRGMYALGVNRVSFGVQSFDAGKLKALGRNHTAEQAISSIHVAADIGFKHISLDLIYNYQNDSKELLDKDIKQASKLPIDHISAYELTIEAHTPFASTPEVRQDDEELAFFVAKSIEALGLEQYEISNFGKYQSLHNKGYWELDNYIGIGAGAVGFLGDTRYYPQTDIESYINNPLKISPEKLSTDELLTEKIFLGLRSCIGVELDMLPSDMTKRAEIL
ncbi:MAG TPA: coproporphyrinogen III oxidase family protein, partial [Sulfurovum sp.]|nr:coproporphyrinogen III oxidase family protein [Sulfurovum sp.]